jgi:hypothetical protein
MPTLTANTISYESVSPQVQALYDRTLVAAAEQSAPPPVVPGYEGYTQYEGHPEYTGHEDTAVPVYPGWVGAMANAVTPYAEESQPFIGTYPAPGHAQISADYIDAYGPLPEPSPEVFQAPEPLQTRDFTPDDARNAHTSAASRLGAQYRLIERRPAHMRTPDNVPILQRYQDATPAEVDEFERLLAAQDTMDFRVSRATGVAAVWSIEDDKTRQFTSAEKEQVFGQGRGIARHRAERGKFSRFVRRTASLIGYSALIAVDTVAAHTMHAQDAWNNYGW